MAEKWIGSEEIRFDGDLRDLLEEIERCKEILVRNGATRIHAEVDEDLILAGWREETANEAIERMERNRKNEEYYKNFRRQQYEQLKKEFENEDI